MEHDRDQVILAAAKEEATRAATAATAKASERLHRVRIDWDVRGILAILVSVGVFALAFTQLALGQTAEIPAWATAIVGGVTGFYFGARGGSSNGFHRRSDD